MHKVIYGKLKDTSELTIRLHLGTSLNEAVSLSITRRIKGERDTFNTHDRPMLTLAFVLAGKTIMHAFLSSKNMRKYPSMSETAPSTTSASSWIVTRDKRWLTLRINIHIV